MDQEKARGLRACLLTKVTPGRTRLSLLAIPVVLVATTSGARAEEQDFAAGKTLAREVCAACHDIGRDRPWLPTLDPPAPSFARLAKRHKLDAEPLRAFLSTPHGRMAGTTTMPNPQLLDYQIDRLLAYLRAARLTR